MLKRELPVGYPHNRGQEAEYQFRYQTTGIIAKADKVPFDEGSDIPEFDMSVKTCRYSLTYKELAGDTVEQKMDDFCKRVASTMFCYIDEGDRVHLMPLSVFRQFVELFHELTYSSDNRNKVIIRGKRITKKTEDPMRVWLANYRLGLF